MTTQNNQNMPVIVVTEHPSPEGPNGAEDEVVLVKRKPGRPRKVREPEPPKKIGRPKKSEEEKQKTLIARKERQKEKRTKRCDELGIKIGRPLKYHTYEEQIQMHRVANKKSREKKKDLQEKEIPKPEKPIPPFSKSNPEFKQHKRFMNAVHYAKLKEKAGMSLPVGKYSEAVAVHIATKDA
eukprot:Lithocolla_globosa_v1_NODE_1_length_16663_cov_42.954359.p9 type:complete len:182 gc:universal NODE_1_length_16663_cov_42.954359:10936-11481(+)